MPLAQRRTLAVQVYRRPLNHLAMCPSSPGHEQLVKSWQHFFFFFIWRNFYFYFLGNLLFFYESYGRLPRVHIPRMQPHVRHRGWLTSCTEQRLLSYSWALLQPLWCLWRLSETSRCLEPKMLTKLHACTRRLGKRPPQNALLATFPPPWEALYALFDVQYPESLKKKKIPAIAASSMTTAPAYGC